MIEDSLDVLKFTWYDSFWFLKEFKKVSLVDTLLSLGLSYIMKQYIYDVVNHSKNQMESKILNMILRNIFDNRLLRLFFLKSGKKKKHDNHDKMRYW